MITPPEFLGGAFARNNARQFSDSTCRCKTTFSDIKQNHLIGIDIFENKFNRNKKTTWVLDIPKKKP
jgi:hypothetical protein